jgi:hypothetical protein
MGVANSVEKSFLSRSNKQNRSQIFYGDKQDAWAESAKRSRGGMSRSRNESSEIMRSHTETSATKLTDNRIQLLQMRNKTTIFDERPKNSGKNYSSSPMSRLSNSSQVFG